MGKYEDLGQANGKEADDDIVELDETIADLKTLTETQATKIDQLTKALADCQAGNPPIPPVPVVKTQFGAALQSGLGSFNDFATRCGGLEVYRGYLVPGKMPLTLKDCGAQTAESIDKRHIVLSWKGSDADINKACDFVIAGSMDSSLKGVMSSKSPKQELTIIFRHEPDEEAFGDGSKFRNAQTRIRSLVNQVNDAGRAAHADWVNVQFAANFMSWSPEVGRNIEPLWTPGAWDVVSWDGYTKKVPYENFDKMWSKVIAWNKAHGNIPIAIGEYGAPPDPTRLAWLNELTVGFKRENFRWVCYWNSAGTGPPGYILNPTEEKALGSYS